MFNDLLLFYDPLSFDNLIVMCQDVGFPTYPYWCLSFLKSHVYFFSHPIWEITAIISSNKLSEAFLFLFSFWNFQNEFIKPLAKSLRFYLLFPSVFPWHNDFNSSVFKFTASFSFMTKSSVENLFSDIFLQLLYLLTPELVFGSFLYSLYVFIGILILFMCYLLNFI
jgi:hypothetical protein